MQLAKISVTQFPEISMKFQRAMIDIYRFWLSERRDSSKPHDELQ